MTFTPLETDRLIIRKWEERDRDLFHRINSDEKVMEFFPFRRTRKQSDDMLDLLNRLIDKNGYSFFALEQRTIGKCIGFCGLHRTGNLPFLKEGAVEIGWRLAPEFRGKGYITEAGIKLLNFGFNLLKLNEIVSFAVHDNIPSIAVMKRLGMTADPAMDFEHPEVPDTHPQLKRHWFYRITKADYLKSHI